jgi:hypothetical protein
MTKEQMDQTILISSMLATTLNITPLQLILWFDKPFMNLDKTPRELIFEDKADILLGAIHRMATGEPSS